ncbi:MAG: DegT/DnrJ/EryC1/StrS family aminotransferase [Candidatus Nitrosopumilus sp. bin_32a]
MKIQLRKPFFPNKSILKIQHQIKNVLKSGQLTLGENVKIFEENFAKYFDMKYAVAVSSATAGLHISLLSLNIKKDDEVIVPAKTFISSANAALYCNAKPIFCDVDESTFQLDPSKIEQLITKKTKAIIPVHLGGNVCDMKKIIKIAKKYKLSIVEDAAHAHGATFNEKFAGTFGEIGVFSFYPDKIMASSDGGIIVTNNRTLFNKLILLRNVGRKSIGEYDYTEIGYNYRMNEIQAILAQEQLRLLPKMLKKRREIAKKYDLEFKELSNIKTQKIPQEVNSGYYAYIMKLKKGNLSKFRKNLLTKGIETSPMFTTVYKTKVYKKLKGKNNYCPNSEKLDSQTFTIPLHPELTSRQINYVIKEIKKLDR